MQLILRLLIVGMKDICMEKRFKYSYLLKRYSCIIITKTNKPWRQASGS